MNIVEIGGDESGNQSSEARCVDSIIVCDHDGASVTFFHLIKLGESKIEGLLVGTEKWNTTRRQMNLLDVREKMKHEYVRDEKCGS